MKDLLFIGNLGMGEIVIIAIVILLLFGGKKIPELMHGLGKGVRSFKEGLKDVEDEIKGEDKKTIESSENKVQSPTSESTSKE